MPNIEYSATTETAAVDPAVAANEGALPAPLAQYVLHLVHNSNDETLDRELIADQLSSNGFTDRGDVASFAATGGVGTPTDGHYVTLLDTGGTALYLDGNWLNLTSSTSPSVVTAATLAALPAPGTLPERSVGQVGAAPFDLYLQLGGAWVPTDEVDEETRFIPVADITALGNLGGAADPLQPGDIAVVAATSEQYRWIADARGLVPDIGPSGAGLIGWEDLLPTVVQVVSESDFHPFAPTGISPETTWNNSNPTDQLLPFGQRRPRRLERPAADVGPFGNDYRLDHSVSRYGVTFYLRDETTALTESLRIGVRWLAADGTTEVARARLDLNFNGAGVATDAGTRDTNNAVVEDVGAITQLIAYNKIPAIFTLDESVTTAEFAIVSIVSLGPGAQDYDMLFGFVEDIDAAPTTTAEQVSLQDSFGSTCYGPVTVAYEANEPFDPDTGDGIIAGRAAPVTFDGGAVWPGGASAFEYALQSGRVRLELAEQPLFNRRYIGVTRDPATGNPVPAEAIPPGARCYLTSITAALSGGATAGAAPSVVLDTPTDGQAGIIENGITLLTSTPADNGGAAISHVTYLVDGTVVGSSSTGPSYSVNWTAVVGPHTVQAVVTNAAGQDAISAVHNITVAPSAPPPAIDASLSGLTTGIA